MRILALWVVVLLGFFVAPRVCAGGYAVQLDVNRNGLPATVRALQALPEMPPQGALAFQADAWTVDLVDATGRSLALHRVPSPARAGAGFMPDRAPLLIQFPDHPSAVRADVRDESGRITATVALGATQRQAAVRRAIAVASERTGPIGARSKASSAAFSRQVDFESRRVPLGLQDCRRRYPMMPPEVVLSREGCEAAAMRWRLPDAFARERGRMGEAGSSRIPMSLLGASRDGNRFVGPAGTLMAEPVETVVPPRLVPAVAAKRLLRELASTWRLSGRLRFPSGSTPPTSSVQLIFWGFDGTGSGAVINATPPEFRYELNVKAGVSVDIEATPPAPFLSTRVPLGTINADLVRDVEVALGISVSGRLVLPPGSTAPTAQVALWLVDGGQWRYIGASPPDFRYSVGVVPGRAYRLEVSPPSPFLPESIDLGTVTADMTRDITLQTGAMITGRLLFPAGGSPPTTTVNLWLVDGNQWRYVAALPPEFRYETVAAPGRSYRIEVAPPSPFLPQSVDLGTVTADVTRDITLRRGVVLSGRLAFPRQAPRPTAPITGSISDGRVGYGLTASPPDFRFAVALEPGLRATLRFNPSSPYLAEQQDLGRVVADRDLTVMMRRGQVFSGVVRVRSEASPRVTVSTSGSVSESGTSITVDPDRSFQLAVGPDDRFIEASATGFQSVAIPVPPSGDFEGELVLVPASATENVRLQVNWSDGRPVVGARVEIWRGGEYLTSAVAMANEGAAEAGRASVVLPDGEYTLHVWPTSEYHQTTPTRLYARPAIIQSVAVRGDTSATLVVPVAEANRVTLQVTLPPALPGCSSASAFGRLELLQDGVVVARGSSRFLVGGSPGSRQSVDVLLGAGRYQLRAVLQGAMQATTPPFVAASGIVAPAGAASPARLLRGVLRDHQGRPLAGRSITPYDDLGGPMWADSCAYRTDSMGRFALPICEGCGFQVRDDGSGIGARQFLRIDGIVDADRTHDIQLAPGLPLTTMAETGTTRVWGDPDAPLRIVFLAEGYAAERESYTDRNGNGVWDGVLWVDVDGDGVYDANEPSAIYGTATAPAAGTDPRLTNEPFADLNGDGVPSFDDRALFERNVHDYLRGLFSTDVFGAYRHAYQAHAVMAYSKQVGMDHGAQWQRDTRFNAAFSPDRGLIGVDYTRAQAEASAALPGFDVVVVMINQPVLYGRVNSFILASGGMKVDGRNDVVGAHEFGHKIAGLADEYTEFQRSYVGGEPGGRNSTRFVRRSMVGWGEMLRLGSEARPSRDFMAGTGLFEGSSYTVAGVFRPTVHSVMRYVEPWFNAPSKVHLDRVHVPALSGRPGRLTAQDAGDCRRVRVSWDASVDGVSGVVIRRGGDRGDVLLSGPALGTFSVDPRNGKGRGGDFVLMDAATGAVLDIEPAPTARCTQ
jgi:hypothetical protein